MDNGIELMELALESVEFNPPLTALSVHASSTQSTIGSKTVKTVILNCQMPAPGDFEDSIVIDSVGL